MQVGLVVPTESLESLGGASRVWRDLFDALAARQGIEPVMVSASAIEADCGSLLEDYARFAELDVDGLDVVIATKYPAWVVDHPRVVVWMQHPLRGLYELYPPDLTGPETGVVSEQLMVAAMDASPTALRELAGIARANPDEPAFGFPGSVARRVITGLDHRAIRHAERVLTISRTVAARQRYFPPGVHPRALLHPQSLDPVDAPVVPGRLFTASRLDQMKRLGLLIEAVRMSPSVTELRIAGSGSDEEQLGQLAKDDPRVKFLGVISDHDLAREYASAAVVPFVPRDEDFGLITLEAWAQARPVVTVSDSGGPAEMVTNNETGLVTSPDALSLSRSIEHLIASPSEADLLGELGRERSRSITWDRVVNGLLRDRAGGPHRSAASSGPTVARRRGAPKVVVVSSEEIGPGRHGGQVRARQLYSSLDSDVTYVSLGSSIASPGITSLGENAVEHVIPRSRAQLDAERGFSDAAGVPVIDEVADRLHSLTPEFAVVLERELSTADVVVMSQPYLAPTIIGLTPSAASIVYDAQNVEAELKTPSSEPSQTRVELHEDVVRLEAAAVEGADLTVSVSADDRRMIADRYGADHSAVVIANGVSVNSVTFVGIGERIARQSRLLELMRAGGATGLALFLGSMHEPNVEGATQLVSEARSGGEASSGLHLLLAGRHVEAVDPKTLPQTVHGLARLGDVRKRVLLSSCAVALNPVTTGSGSNLKIVEYLAAGCAVVSTEFGARGFDDLGDAITIVEPGSLLAASADLGRDPLGNQQRAERGRTLVEANYDWKSLSQKLAAELNHL